MKIGNVRLARAIQRAIRSSPTQFCMHFWFSGRSESGVEPANCNTAACIGGWSVVLSRKNSNPAKCSRSYPQDMVARAAQLLKIKPNREETYDMETSLDGDRYKRWRIARRLFSTDYWPTKYQDRWEKALRMPNGKHKANSLVKIACGVIDYFIKGD